MRTVEFVSRLKRIRKSVSSVATNPRIANLLERIADYPNIPRKKPKFVVRSHGS